MKCRGFRASRGFALWTPTRALSWTFWGTYSAPRLPAVSGNDRWPLTQCEYSVIIRDMDFFPSFHWRDTNFFGNFCWRDKNFFHGSFPQNTGPVLPINNEQSLTVHMNFSLTRGNFERRVTHCTTPGNRPCQGNFSPCEQNAKVAPGKSSLADAHY